ncbi:MAG TPA: hypothetical protein VHF22_06550 [Planctomycetota bacterium]|nr:hypothetical protein [Planctomycetota bacterium]
MRHGLRNLLAPLGLIAAGALASQALTPGGQPFLSAQSRSNTGGTMQVINNAKSNDTMVFVYDDESKRLLVYIADRENGVRLSAIRNTTFDAKVNEYPKHPDDKVSYSAVKKAVEEEEKQQEKQRAEDEAKKSKETKKPAPPSTPPPAPPAPPAGEHKGT